MSTDPLASLWLSTGQVATLLQCSNATVQRIPRADLAYKLVGTHRRYRYQDVQTYIANQKTGEDTSSE